MPESFRHWWATKAPLERRTLTTVAGLAVAVLAWLVLWQPLMRAVDNLAATRERDAVQLAAARRSVDAILRQAHAPLPPAVAPRVAVQQALARHPLAIGTPAMDWRDERAYVTIGAIPFAVLVPWLDALQRDGVRVVDAVLSARVEPGMVRAELTLAR